MHMNSKKQLFRQRKSTKAQTGLVTLTLLRCRHYGPRIFARYFWYTGVLLRDLPSQADHSQVRGRLSNNNISACRVVNWLSWVGYTTHIWCSRGLVELFYIPTYLLPLLYYPSAHATQKVKAGDAKGQITTTTICSVYFSKFNLRSTPYCNKLGLAYFLFFFISSTATKR